MSDEKTEDYSSEIFPFPKIVQTFNYFFPKQKGASDIFTMQNLHKFSRMAPYLTLAILGILLASWIRDCLYAQAHSMGEDIPSKYAFYAFFDTIGLIFMFVLYLWWLGASLFAKLFRRSTVIPRAMSFIDPCRFFLGICIMHVFGFIFGGLCDLAK